jgi:hypothetical protein
MNDILDDWPQFLSFLDLILSFALMRLTAEQVGVLIAPRTGDEL